MKKEAIDVRKLMKEFQEYERLETGQRGSLKIDIPFEQAVKRIAKVKPEPKKGKKHG